VTTSSNSPEKPAVEKPAVEKPAAEETAAEEPAAEEPIAPPVRGLIPVTPDNVAAAPKNAVTTASGLASIVLRKGTGTKKPLLTDTVKVHYSGWTTDGKMFDSSHRRGKPSEFPLNSVLKGWAEGVALMVEGEIRRFWIPGKLAYGDTPRRPGAPAGTLVFDIELIEIKKALSPAEVKKIYTSFIARLTGAIPEVCACTTIECAQKILLPLRAAQPKVRPSPEVMAQLQQLSMKFRACLDNLRPNP